MIYTPFDWWIEYNMWLMLQFKFTGPAKMMARGADMENYLKCFSLNGIHNPNICKPE